MIIVCSFSRGGNRHRGTGRDGDMVGVRYPTRQRRPYCWCPLGTCRLYRTPLLCDLIASCLWSGCTTCVGGKCTSPFCIVALFEKCYKGICHSKFLLTMIRFVLLWWKEWRLDCFNVLMFYFVFINDLLRCVFSQDIQSRSFAYKYIFKFKVFQM